MKVIQIIPSFQMGGAEIMCENLIYALKDKGVNILAVSLYSQSTPITSRMESKGFDIIYLDKKRGLDLSMISKLHRIFKKEKPDAIHTHLYAIQYAIPASLFCKIRKKVHTVHSVAEKELIKPIRYLAKLFYKFFGVVPVALSEAVQDTIVEEYNLPKEKIPVIYNGIDFSKCLPKTNYEIGDHFKILHIGRLEKVKNHEMLVRAFKRFHDMHSDSVLQLIGDGTEKNNIESIVKELQLETCVEFLGIQSNVYGFLNEADVFALPSLYEGIPMTLIEAMGTGLPIVASNVGGIPDMLENEKSALLIDVDEVKLTDAFLQLRNDKRKRKHFGKESLNRSSVFSFRNMADKYFNLYT